MLGTRFPDGCPVWLLRVEFAEDDDLVGREGRVVGRDHGTKEDDRTMYLVRVTMADGERGSWFWPEELALTAPRLGSDAPCLPADG